MNYSIVFEDDYIIVVNKPSGLLVIPTPKGEKNTLTDLLNNYLHSKSSTGTKDTPKAHPCHRLDRDTSGLILYAKGKLMQQKLMAQFHQKQVEKKYLAFIQGHPKKQSGLINYKLEGKEALTKDRVVKYYMLSKKCHSCAVAPQATHRVTQWATRKQESRPENSKLDSRRSGAFVAMALRRHLPRWIPCQACLPSGRHGIQRGGSDTRGGNDKMGGNNRKDIFGQSNYNDGYSLVEAEPLTGRTNQIRLHFKMLGHPVVGERRFAFAKDYKIKAKRLLLHSSFISFAHPVTGQKISFTCEMPTDMII